MGKESKKVPVKQGKPITDFFTRKNGATHMAMASQPKLPVSPTGGQSHLFKPTKVYPPPRLDKPVVSVSSDSSCSVSNATRSTLAVPDSSILPPTRSRTFMEAVEIVSPPKSAKTRNGSQYPSLKRPHSPDMQNITSPNSRSQRRVNLKSPTAKHRSRRSKFDSDSDHGQPESVVYLSKYTQPGSAPAASVQVAPFSPKENLTCVSPQTKSDSRKKPRMSSPFFQPLTEDFVPSSLSDEDMLPQLTSQVNTQVKKKIVNDWLQNTPLPAAAGSNSGSGDMDVDTNASSSLSSEKPSSAFMDSISSTLFTSLMYNREAPPFNRPSSPSPPLPPSPMAIDKEAESARIIADIKAKAYAAIRDSPLEESPPPAFKEELDDSSDEEDLFPFSQTGGKSKSNLSKMKPSQFQPPASRHSGRYSLRSREQSPPPSTSGGHSLSSSASRPARATSSRAYVAPTHVPGRKPSKANPLEELLKEKRLADKRGKGEEAIRLAEVALAGRDVLLEEMNEEDWTNEAAARTAVAERERMELKSGPLANDTASDEMVLDAEDKQRLFGEARGKAIEDILDGDRAKTRTEKANERISGVLLWSEGVLELDDHMKIDGAITMSELKDSHPILRLLKTCIVRKDYTQATLLIDSGVIASISFADHTSVIPYFCDLALSYQEESLSASSFRLLRHIWDNSSRPMPGISFACILSCLVRIGAQTAVLERMGWTLAPGLRHDPTAIQKRDDILYRLVALLTSSARSRKLSNDEVPDILMAMLLIANEPSSSFELQREIMLAIDAVCQSIASGADISAPLESAICTRMLSYASTLEPINKAYIISVLEGGSGRTRRLARWIAHAIITDKSMIAAKSYNDLPPLLPVYEQLVGKNSDGDVEPMPGKLELHRNTDYVDMGIFVQILSAALSNVIAYVAKERKAPRPRSLPSGSLDNSDKPQPDTMLELIVKAMMALHSRISDTRAAHLERSRTKAALHGVAFRVHYQRLASLRSSTAGTGKPRNLLQYFTK